MEKVNTFVVVVIVIFIDIPQRAIGGASWWLVVLREKKLETIRVPFHRFGERNTTIIAAIAIAVAFADITIATTLTATIITIEEATTGFPVE
jgi:hypothetical protein